MIRRNRNTLPLDTHGREIRDDGLDLFNFVANDEDMHQYAAGYIPFHWHEELELFMLLDGNITVTADSKSFSLSAGQGCFFNSSVLHSFQSETTGSCRFRSYVFSPSVIAGMPGSIFDIKYIRPLIENGPACFRFADGDSDNSCAANFRQIFDICLSESPGYEFDVRSALSAIALDVLDHSHVGAAQKPSSASDQRIKQMLSMINANLTNKIQAEDIAAAANVCTRVCQRLFQEYLHCRPIEYLNQQRILAAAADILATDEPVLSISLNYCFSSPGYFTKLFKRYIGYSPREYRLKVWDQP